MGKPVVGVIANNYFLEERFSVQMTGDRNLWALAQVCDALPLIFPGMPEVTDIGALLDCVDGVLLTGGRANVHPTLFDTEPHPAYEPYDKERDLVALEISRACVERAIPLFGVCRGLQEMNVAFGGTLHPEVSDLPGRVNHRAPRLENGEFHPDPEVVFADRHAVNLVEGGELHRLFDCHSIEVNSLHGQAVLEPGERVVIEGVCEDETIEAIRIAEAPSFALGVQWHAEYDAQTNPVNRLLFQSFGQALAVKSARH